MRRLMSLSASAFKPPSFFYITLAAAMLFFPAAAARAEEAPSVDTLKQVLDLRLHESTPVGVKKRTVQFSQVRAGKSKNGVDYPFEVSGVIQDYDTSDAGGLDQTCVIRMDRLPVTLKKNTYDEWEADLNMVQVTHRECKNR